jgi:hypothetical protein
MGTTCEEGSARQLICRSREEKWEEGGGRLGGFSVEAGAMWRGGVGV